MTGQTEEITMFPYQIYKALSDEHIRDLTAEARRYELASAAIRARRDLTEPSSRLKGAAARMRALLHVRHGARARSTMTSASGAGPMGCSA
jgi:hypothetical protein